jgi:hypothetical protein
MILMPGTEDHPWSSFEQRIQRALERCLDWSQQGQHRRVLAEVERLLKTARGNRHVEAQLLIWKAQALLSMGEPERALIASRESWQLASSPHACHLMATSLSTAGDTDHAEELLLLGVELFPDAIHLPVQLAMMLADQGRLPEALQVLDHVSPSTQLPDDMQVFLVGLRANLLATTGRWSEAEAVLEEGLGRHPGSTLLLETHHTIRFEWSRKLAEESLAASWREDLDRVPGVAAEVDEAIVACADVLEVGELVELSARRLWRAYDARESVRVQTPGAWAAALVAAVLELDGYQPSVAAIGRAARSNPSTVRSALRRIRSYLGSLDPELSRRAFGTVSNPRLDDLGPPKAGELAGTVVKFPGADT